MSSMAASKTSTAKPAILKAGLAAFTSLGYETATVEEIRRKAGVSNGSFFHFFPNKQALAVTLFVEALRQYHTAMMAALASDVSAEAGIARLVSTHVEWVVAHRDEALFLFEQSRSGWIAQARDEQSVANRELRGAIEAWREPLAAAGDLAPMSADMFVSQIIGPAQIFCRAWLSGRESEDPRIQLDALIACAVRAVRAR